MASDFSSSGSDWARQILQPHQRSWPTNTSTGLPSARTTPASDDVAATRPPTIRDRLLNMVRTPRGGRLSIWVPPTAAGSRPHLLVTLYVRRDLLEAPQGLDL